MYLDGTGGHPNLSSWPRSSYFLLTSIIYIIVWPPEALHLLPLPQFLLILRSSTVSLSNLSSSAGGRGARCPALGPALFTLLLDLWRPESRIAVREHLSARVCPGALHFFSSVETRTCRNISSPLFQLQGPWREKQVDQAGVDNPGR